MCSVPMFFIDVPNANVWDNTILGVSITILNFNLKNYVYFDSDRMNHLVCVVFFFILIKLYLNDVQYI